LFRDALLKGKSPHQRQFLSYLFSKNSGAEGAYRTRDQPITKWIEIPHPLCFLRLQFGLLPEEKRKERLKKKKDHKLRSDLRTGLFRMTGTDQTRIDGIDVMTAMTTLSEAGWDMSKWETEDHFVSWLRLCPDNRISCDKLIGKSRLPTNKRVTTALKMAANSLRIKQDLSRSTVPPS
jgi:Transposase IS116/IS110/IS902 family